MEIRKWNKEEEKEEEKAKPTRNETHINNSKTALEKSSI